MRELLDRLRRAAQFFAADAAVHDLIVAAFRSTGRQNLVLPNCLAGRVTGCRDHYSLTARYLLPSGAVGSHNGCGVHRASCSIAGGRSGAAGHSSSGNGLGKVSHSRLEGRGGSRIAVGVIAGPAPTIL